MRKKEPFIINCYVPQPRDVYIYFFQKGIPEQEAELFFRFYANRQWKNSHGQLIKNWKSVTWRWYMKVMKLKPWLFNKNYR